MALFDFFKKKKKEVKKKPPFKKTSEDRKEGKVAKEAPGKVKKKIIGIGSEVLFSPHVTEKATILNEQNKYVFKIQSKANKTEVKKAIVGLYGVDVVGVNIVNIHRKKRRVGRHSGWTKGYKKAIVKIKQGQKIEILPK